MKTSRKAGMFCGAQIFIENTAISPGSPCIYLDPSGNITRIERRKHWSRISCEFIALIPPPELQLRRDLPDDSSHGRESMQAKQHSRWLRREGNYRETFLLVVGRSPAPIPRAFAKL